MSQLILFFINIVLSPFTKKFFDQFEKNNFVTRTVDLYPNKKFIKIRFWDAPFVQVEHLISQSGLIVDIGCGEGIFSNFLGISSAKRKVLGIEIDRDRLKFADRGVKNVSFKWGDATKVNIPKADAIVLFHLLHHLESYEDQEKVIKMCINQLKRKGKLIIVEAEKKLSFKFIITWVTDHFVVPILFERRIYSPIFFRMRKEWAKVLDKAGFFYTITSAEKGHPFTHIIIECRKN